VQSGRPTRLTSRSRQAAQRDEVEHLLRQGVADPGDRADSPAIHEAVEYLRVDADHQQQRGAAPGDVLGGAGERGGAAELLEADEIGVTRAQIEEQVGLVS